jgi:hypothetical protein
LSIANAVFLNEATDGIAAIAPNLSRQTIQTAISGGVASYRRTELEVRGLVLHTIVKAMSKIYFLPLSAGALTVVMSVFMKRRGFSSEGYGALRVKDLRKGQDL